MRFLSPSEHRVLSHDHPADAVPTSDRVFADVEHTDNGRQGNSLLARVYNTTPCMDICLPFILDTRLYG